MKKISFIMALALVLSLLALPLTVQADPEVVFDRTVILDMSEADFATAFANGEAIGATESTLDGERAMHQTGERCTYTIRYPEGLNITDYEFLAIRVKFEGEAQIFGMFGNLYEQNMLGLFSTSFLLVNLDGSIEDELMGTISPTVFDFDGWIYINTTVLTWQGGASSERAIGERMDMESPMTEIDPAWSQHFDSDHVGWIAIHFVTPGGSSTVDFGDVALANDATPPDPNTPKIYAGTPTVDGVLDDIYLGSARIGVGGAFYAQGGADKETESQIDAATYMLHDADHLYLCTVVTGDSYVKVVEGASWVNDAVEHYLAVNKKNYRISVDADGTVFTNASGIEAQVATTKSDNGWVIEIALPVEVVYDKLVEYGLQVNDRLDDGDKLVAHGVQEFNREFLMSADAAVAPTATPEPTATPVPATQAPTDAPTTAPTDAPATATPAPAANDGNLTWLWIVIAAVVVVAVIVVIVVLGKKKK
ncbi:MAG: hypothetical protein KIG36_05385 [Eubacteriales bacterium]|nr:hypothetical protein [Eubacteriales bacterium]